MRTINGIKIFEVIPEVQEPITKDGRISFRTNAILFKNAGTNIAVLDGGITLLRGEAFSFGSTQDLNVLKIEWQVNFFSGSTPTPNDSGNRLEVVLQNIHSPELAGYIDQGKLR
jgi:hypothetical protein